MTPDLQDPYPGWARRLAASDEAALAELFDALHDALLHYVVGLLRDEAAAHDVVQETFVRLWRHRATLDPARSLRALLYRTARNLAYNATRDARLRAALLDGDDAESWLPGDVLPWRAPAPDSRTEALELGQRLQAGIAALPERQREALLLSRFGGLSHDEVAGVMGCAPRTVNNHLVRALATLRAYLDVAPPGTPSPDAYRASSAPPVPRPPLAADRAAYLPPWSAPEALLP